MKDSFVDRQGSTFLVGLLYFFFSFSAVADEVLFWVVSVLEIVASRQQLVVPGRFPTLL
jgi:hypothetical protein